MNFKKWIESHMDTDQIYDELLRRGWHEDYLDELSKEQLMRLYQSGTESND